MVESLVALLLSYLWPTAPAWLAPLVVKVVPQVIAIVQQVQAASGHVAPELAVAQVVVLLDEVLDHTPVLSEWSEEDRDELVAAVAKAALVIARNGDTEKIQRRTVADIRKGLRKARREVK